MYLLLAHPVFRDDYCLEVCISVVAMDHMSASGGNLTPIVQPVSHYIY
jgi:hypothetical protein